MPKHNLITELMSLKRFFEVAMKSSQTIRQWQNKIPKPSDLDDDNSTNSIFLKWLIATNKSKEILELTDGFTQATGHRAVKILDMLFKNNAKALATFLSDPKNSDVEDWFSFHLSELKQLQQSWKKYETNTAATSYFTSFKEQELEKANKKMQSGLGPEATRLKKLAEAGLLEKLPPKKSRKAQLFKQPEVKIDEKSLEDVIAFTYAYLTPLQFKSNKLNEQKRLIKSTLESMGEHPEEAHLISEVLLDQFQKLINDSRMESPDLSEELSAHYKKINDLLTRSENPSFSKKT